MRPRVLPLGFVRARREFVRVIFACASVGRGGFVRAAFGNITGKRKHLDQLRLGGVHGLPAHQHGRAQRCEPVLACTQDHSPGAHAVVGDVHRGVGLALGRRGAAREAAIAAGSFRAAQNWIGRAALHRAGSMAGRSAHRLSHAARNIIPYDQRPSPGSSRRQSGQVQNRCDAKLGVAPFRSGT